MARGVRAKQGRRRRVLQGVSIPPPPPPLPHPSLPPPSSGPTTPSYFPLLQSRAPSLHSSSPQTRTTTLHSTRNNCFCLEGVRGGGKGGAHGLPLWRKKGVFEGQPVTSPFACILFLLRLLLLPFSPLSPPPRSARLPPSPLPSFSCNRSLPFKHPIPLSPLLLSSSLPSSCLLSPPPFPHWTCGCHLSYVKPLRRTIKPGCPLQRMTHFS